MSTEPVRSARDSELRRMLVATASAQLSRSRSRGVASIAAFCLAGALTGGAVSALAMSADDRTTTVSVEDMRDSVVYDDAQLFGTPIVISGQGTTTINLGQAPQGAEGIAVAFHCSDAGTYAEIVDGVQNTSHTCSAEDTAYTNGGGYSAVSGPGDHTLTISTDRANRFVIWTSWANPAGVPEPSAAQAAALADGEVSEMEYQDAFDRYEACMIAAGAPLVRVDRSGVIISYANVGDAVTSGAEGRCYALEFSGVDVAWQARNEDTSETAKVIGDCLTARGITPEPTLEARTRQLDAIPLTFLECFDSR